MQSVLVTGASGNTGSALLAELDRRGIHAIAGVSGRRRGDGARVDRESRSCDFDRPHVVAASLKGIHGLYLMAPFHERMLERAALVVEQAQRAGVQFIVRLSGLAAAPGCGSKMGALHGCIDEMVMNSGVAWCILRCNSFMQNFSGLYRPMLKQRHVLAVPEATARSAFIDTADIGAAAGAVFADPASHASQAYDLDGPQALDNAQAMAVLAAVTGIPMTYRPITDVQARAGYSKLGLSAWKMDVLESLSRFIRAGNGDVRSGALEALLGRPPTTFQEFAVRHRSCWI